MSKPSILLVITGSVAAYKSLELIRKLQEKSIEVTCVLTEGGKQFVTPLSVASLSGNPVYSELFSLKDETEMGHIRLSREHDLIAVVPASANILAKMAQGYADDLASTLLLASDAPIVVAPAMNVKMWENPAVKRNVSQLKKDGIRFIGPEKGALACGEQGEGRMVEVDRIVDKILASLEMNVTSMRPLSGKKALVTSGPTIEAIDPVRYIANRSSGKQGHAIAAALQALGADVTLISGPTTLAQPEGVTLVPVESASEMLDAVYRLLPVDIAVCAAAVSDWRVVNYTEQKIKKQSGNEDLTFTFMENPDVLECLSKHEQNRPSLVVGFAAETEDILQNARTKLRKKGCDWILANDVSNGNIFGLDDSSIHFITEEGVEDWPSLSKIAIAEKLAQKIAEHMHETSKSLKLVRRKG